MGHVSFGGRRAAIVGLLLVSLVLPLHADEAGDLLCLESEWAEASASYSAKRDLAWEAVDTWLKSQAPALDCRRSWDHIERFGGNPDDEYSLVCADEAQNHRATLTFEEADNQRGILTGLLPMLFAMSDYFESDEFQQEVTEISEQMNVALKELVTALPVDGVEAQLAPIEEVEPETVGPSTQKTDINPLQGPSGLTVWMSISETDPLPKATVLYINHLLDLIKVTKRDAGSAGAARRAVVDIVTRQAGIVSGDNLALSASRFQPFGQTADVVSITPTYISAYDITSWRKQPDVEGVVQLIFYIDPQLEFSLLTKAADPCGGFGQRACSLKQRKGALSVFGDDDPQLRCDKPEGCRITHTRWLNDHIALRTFIWTHGPADESLKKFAQSLLTAKTRKIVEVLSASADEASLRGCDP